MVWFLTENPIKLRYFFDNSQYQDLCKCCAKNMSLFRKPKKIQRRVFCADDDEDGGEPEAPPPPVISQEKEKKEKEIKKTALLSFADEGNEA